MAFEFYGSDLETDEGVKAFKYVYTVAAKAGNAIELEEDLDTAGYANWLENSPEQAEVLLRNLAADSSPHARNLAGVLAVRDWMVFNYEIGLEVASQIMLDEDPVAREEIADFAEDMIKDVRHSGWLDSLGIAKMHRVETAISKNRQAFPDEDRNNAVAVAKHKDELAWHYAAEVMEPLAGVDSFERQDVEAAALRAARLALGVVLPTSPSVG